MSAISDDPEDIVFLTPEEDPSDHGASPALRRSARKRKSTTSDMLKGSGSKKKKGGSPAQKEADPGKSMPRIPRTPQGGQPPRQTEERPEAVSTFEALLLAMEGRLSSKIDKSNEVARQVLEVASQTKMTLDDMEARVKTNEDNIKQVIERTEDRVMHRVKDQIKELITDQLKQAGFDPDLTAGALSTLPVNTPARPCPPATNAVSYAAAAAAQSQPERTKTSSDRRSDRFWDCRRSLRLWPMKQGSTDELQDFLLNKLDMSQDFVDNIGQLRIRLVKDRRAKVKDEAVVVFETKEIRDAIRARASNLSDYRDTAGMRLELPDYLQKDFRALMNLAYDLKAKHPTLRRNVKFDEEDMGLFMDIQTSAEERWRRIKPDQARKLARTRSRGPEKLNDSDIVTLLGDEAE